MTILATLCYVVQGDQVLMLYRNKKENDWHQGKYNGLGGKFLPGESPENCMVREVQEESGLTPTAWSLKGVITFPNFDMKNDWYCFLYRIDDVEGDLIDSPEGTLEWVAIKDVTQLPLWAGDKVFLPYIFESKGWFSGNFIYNNKNLESWELKEYL